MYETFKPSCSSILLEPEPDKGVKRGIRLGSISISSERPVSHYLSKIGATRLWCIGACIFLIIVFKVVTRVFLMVVFKVVNCVPHVVYLLVLNSRHTIEKITLKAGKSK
jgi:hypothetical protein